MIIRLTTWSIFTMRSNKYNIFRHS